jgi:hypothetical protein
MLSSREYLCHNCRKIYVVYNEELLSQEFFGIYICKECTTRNYTQLQEAQLQHPEVKERIDLS